MQIAWALILGGGIASLPDSPRYYVKRGKIEKAVNALSRVRGQPADSEYVQQELAEIIANHEYELRVVPQGSYFASWAACFHGSIWNGASNLRRTILGTSLQMMQQWTGVNFVSPDMVPLSLQELSSLKMTRSSISAQPSSNSSARSITPSSLA